MKRKIFSKLLMGALLVASVSSFTSCKDYDDDIKKNTDDISALTKQISTLETALNTTKQEAAANYATKTEIAKLATAEALQKSISDLQAKVQGNSSKTIAELANDIDAINPKLNTLGTTLDNIQTAAQAAIKNLEMQQTVLDRLQKEVEGDGSSIAGLKDDVATLKDEVAKVKNVIGSVTSLDELAQKMTELSNKIDDSIDVLTVLVSGTLKSLVFQPDFYIGGIEATEAPAIVYVPLRFNGNDVTFSYYPKGSTTAKNDGKILAGVETNSNSFKTHAVNIAAGGALNKIAAWFTAANVLTDKDNATYITLPNGTAVTTANKIALAYPGIWAQYHMNPSTVNKDNIVEVGVVSDDKDTYTRTAASKPAVKSWDAVNGTLFAQIGLNYVDIATTAATTATKGKVTVLATQAHYKDAAADTTITSDYAAVAPSVITNLIIADKGAANGKVACAIPNVNAMHAFTKASDAIGSATPNTVATTAAPAHEIAWNSAGFDLNEVVQVHAVRKVYNGTNVIADANEFVVTPEQLKKWGFELQYELVQYTTGTEFTNQSTDHATLTGSILKPTGINGQQTNASIGRMPLVLVKLIDTNNNNQLAQIGYIKFKIVAEKADNVDVALKEGTKYWTCNGVADQVTWEVVESKILDNAAIRANGIAKTTFETLYTLDDNNGASTQANINAYTVGPHFVTTYIKVNGKWASAANMAVYNGTKINGINMSNTVLSYVFNTVGSTRTGIVRYNITSAMIKEILAKKNAKMDKYLKTNGQETDDLNDADIALDDEVEFEFAARVFDAAEGGLPDVYTVFKLKVSKLALTINKIANYWYAANNATAGSGVEDIHVNHFVVWQNATAQSAVFEGNFLSTVVGNKLAVAPVATPQNEWGFTVANLDNAQRAEITTGGTSAVAGKLYFIASGSTKAELAGNATVSGFTIVKDEKGDVATGVSGAKYLIVPGTDPADNYSAIFAIKADANGKYTSAPEYVAYVDNTAAGQHKIILRNNNTTKDLLNYASHKDLENSLTAHMQVKASMACGPTIPVLVTNDKFNVKFLRPIDVEGAPNKKFDDAVTGGNILNLIDLIKFNDWRELWQPKYDATDADLFSAITGTSAYKTNLFDNSVVERANYYTFYNVTAINADIANITTDLNGGDIATKKLSSVSPLLQVTQQASVPAADGSIRSKKMTGAAATTYPGTWNATGVDLQTLKYNNNGLTVGEFNIRVPLEIVYDWGATGYTLKTTVDIHVGHTIEN